MCGWLFHCIVALLNIADLMITHRRTSKQPLFASRLFNPADYNANSGASRQETWETEGIDDGTGETFLARQLIFRWPNGFPRGVK